ncbi:MAG: hypothetical protein QME78_07580 [Thermodesulfobacteriota bacterium]|nr:hypothetical protein [Thermodesulfobacteriota bacterium]
MMQTSRKKDAAMEKEGRPTSELETEIPGVSRNFLVIDLWPIRILMGHISFATTQRYAHHFVKSLRSGSNNRRWRGKGDWCERGESNP